MNNLEKKEILSRIYWDMEVDPEKLLSILEGKTDRYYFIDKLNIYSRLLKSCDWYTLLKIIPAEHLTDLLSDEVINRLYPKNLQDKFLYARSILQQ